MQLKRNGANIISLVFERSVCNRFHLNYFAIIQKYETHDNIKNKILNNFCRIFSYAI